MVRSEDISWSVRALRWARSPKKNATTVVATPTLSPTRPTRRGTAPRTPA